MTEPALPRLRLRRLMPLAAIATAVTLVYATGWHRALSLETLVGHRAAIDAFIAGHRALAVLIYVGLYAAATAGALPAGGALAVAGGFLFGTLVGGLGAALGSTIGATTLYLIARGAFGEPAAARPVRCCRASRPVSGRTRSAMCCSCGSFRRRPGSPAWRPVARRPARHVRRRDRARAPAGKLRLRAVRLGPRQHDGDAGSRLPGRLPRGGGADCRVDFDPAHVLTPTLVAGFIALALLALVPVLARNSSRGC